MSQINPCSSKIHLKWTIGVLLGVLVVVIAAACVFKDATTLGTFIALAATLSSLTLSVVVLLHAFLSEKSYHSMMADLRASTTGVKELTEMSETIGQRMGPAQPQADGIEGAEEDRMLAEEGTSPAAPPEPGAQGVAGEKGKYINFCNEQVKEFYRLVSVDGLLALYAFWVAWQVKQEAPPEKKEDAGRFRLRLLFRRLGRGEQYAHAYGFVVACRALHILYFTASRGKWTPVAFNDEFAAKLRAALDQAVAREEERTDLALSRLPKLIEGYFSYTPSV